MALRKVPVALALAAFAVAPVAAQAAPISRAAAPTADESELRGSLLWIALIIAVLIAAILLLDGDDAPASP